MTLFPIKIYIFQEHHQQQLSDQFRQLYHQIMVFLFLSFICSQFWWMYNCMLC